MRRGHLCYSRPGEEREERTERKSTNIHRLRFRENCFTKLRLSTGMSNNALFIGTLYQIILVLILVEYLIQGVLRYFKNIHCIVLPILIVPQTTKTKKSCQEQLREILTGSMDLHFFISYIFKNKLYCFIVNVGRMTRGILLCGLGVREIVTQVHVLH